MPPNAEYFLNRPNIEDLLREAIKKPLITVIAGAGYGKTQAVSGILGFDDENVIWFQLSELDNLMPRFWERFIYAFKSHSAKIWDSLASLGYPGNVPAFDRFLRLLAEELPLNKHFIIVLDDFYFIHDKTVINFLESLIEARISNISIMLISRTKPNLNLAGMLSKGLLARITEEDLRFSENEMSDYFTQRGLKLSKNMLANTYSCTEGWIFAIYLVGLSIQQGNVCEDNPISLAKLDIYELIDREIFRVASKKLKTFLIKISLFDGIQKQLLLELANNDDSILTELTEISLFLRYDSLSDSYRIHQLFRDFLLERKNKLSEDEKRKIHLAAAIWYKKNNFKTEALEHYRICGCYDKIFDIILSVKRHVSKEAADSFIELIEQAPQRFVTERPIILIAKAYYLLNNNKIQKAYDELTILRKEYEALSKTSEGQSILGEVYIVLALISIIHQSLEFEELFNMANSCLPCGSALVDHNFNIAEGINICGIQNPAQGVLKRYMDTLFRVMPCASRIMNGCGYGVEFLNAADTYYMTGDIDSAEKYAYQAISHAKQKQQYGIEGMANFILVRIYVMKGSYSKVITVMNQMKELTEKCNNFDVIYIYDVIKGWIYVKIGEIEKIPKWILREEDTRKKLAPVILGREYLVRSDTLLAQGRYYELLAFMEQQDRLYIERGILYAIIQNKITRAIIFHFMDNHEESMKVLNEAYELSSPNNLVIQYIEYGNQMRTVIHSALNDKNCKIPKEWLDNIYKKSSTYAKWLARVIAEYKSNYSLGDKSGIILSKREKEILSCLGAGLTRDEIAVHCNISINTVKSVIKNILDKLGALNSMEAVRIATEMHLI